MFIKRIFVLIITLAVLSGLFISHVHAAESPQELEWTDLIPQGFNPDEVLAQYQKEYDIDNLSDDDPRIAELTKKLEALMKDAPVNDSLAGKTVRLPGFVVPLETDGEKSSEFLLVPYYGACIHVPPPPANQTIHVTTRDKKGAAIRQLFDVVWVTGVIDVEQFSSDLADAGYTIDATKVEPYE
ncbi:DUF3299 domain-containing protein [Sedimenticola selenatireducens]|uniref:DUF3299 domain-containing protein n=1 Tax=Sedimenticola selenatireducens TaxID=191960 RepID=A0A558DW11_9GAMM|nr:DUF3299 domain-containing protein [Sedimenticola selenatireducens]TVO77905.1 DUF3299 domain-containing protein [Sedimenticola selenatireducens]TVT65210.1 MAG: DUF3299 domain-containing protein [Sedimenticola selenatireducens]